jgi:hypothetical protein
MVPILATILDCLLWRVRRPVVGNALATQQHMIIVRLLARRLGECILCYSMQISLHMNDATACNPHVQGRVVLPSRRWWVDTRHMKLNEASNAKPAMAAQKTAVLSRECNLWQGPLDPYLSACSSHLPIRLLRTTVAKGEGVRQRVRGDTRTARMRLAKRGGVTVREQSPRSAAPQQRTGARSAPIRISGP